jgi:hypothetical protein
VCVEVDVEVPDAEAVAVLEIIDVGVGFDELEDVADEDGEELIDGDFDTEAVSLVEGLAVADTDADGLEDVDGLAVTDTDAEGLEEELGLAVADTDADEEGVGTELNVDVGVAGGPIWQ